MPLLTWISISAQSSSWEVCVFGEELRILCVQFVVVPFALVCTEYSLDCSERVSNFVDLFISCFWCLDSGLFVRWKQISLFFASFFVFSLFVFLLPLYPELV